MSNQPIQSWLSFEALQARCGIVWGTLPDALQLRIRRALSWIERAEKESADQDAAFIFYWIAFNAVYAEDRLDALDLKERGIFHEYFGKIIELDAGHVIYDAIWNRFSQGIRVFLNNRYVFQPFWKHHNGVPGYENWEDSFERSKAMVHRALGHEDTRTILSTLFDRLYVLRNQLIHGGATWRSSVNRDQVRDGRSIVAFLVPLFVYLMVTNPQVPWGAPYYPVVN